MNFNIRLFWFSDTPMQPLVILRFSDYTNNSSHTIIPIFYVQYDSAILRIYDSSDSNPIIQFITISSVLSCVWRTFLSIREIASALYTMTKNKPYMPGEVCPPAYTCRIPVISCPWVFYRFSSSEKLLAG